MTAMFNSDVVDIFKYYLKKYFAQSLVVALAILSASLVEVLGFMALLPFFTLFLNGTSSSGADVEGSNSIYHGPNSAISDSNLIIEWVNDLAVSLEIPITAQLLLTFIALCLVLKGVVRFVSLRYVGHSLPI